MPTYNLKITIPNWLDLLLASPLVLGRLLWYGYTFRRIRLNIGKYALVDPSRFHELTGYDWCAKKNATTYMAVRFTPQGSYNIPVYMHRQILNTQKGQIVDHIDRNGLNNTIENLRFATKSQNGCNKQGRRNTSSKYKGIAWNRHTQRWIATIYFDGKRMHLGYFDSENDAAKAYDTAAKKYHREFAYLNFPEKKVKGLKSLLFFIFNFLFEIRVNPCNPRRKKI
jgi:hypothetical protein